MAPWVRKTFVDILPRYLFIQRPEKGDEPEINFLHDEIPTSQSIPTQEEEHFSENASNPLVILADGDLVNFKLSAAKFENVVHFWKNFGKIFFIKLGGQSYSLADRESYLEMVVHYLE